MTLVQEGWNWYVAEIVVESLVEGDPRPVAGIHAVLLHAVSPDDAYASARAFCESPEHAYRNSEGVPVVMRYVGIHELDNLQVAELSSGTVLATRRLDGLAHDGIRALCRGRDELALFGASSDGDPKLDQ